MPLPPTLRMTCARLTGLPYKLKAKAFQLDLGSLSYSCGKLLKRAQEPKTYLKDDYKHGGN